MSHTNCVNHELCNNEAIIEDFCITCKYWFSTVGLANSKLSVIDSVGECMICFKSCRRKLEFPADCGHVFCLHCSSHLLFGDDTRFYLSPEPYGCPPCPKGCTNPLLGRQCGCVEYVAIQEIWETTDVLGASRWFAAEAKSVEVGRWLDISSYGSAVCPLCRKAVKQA
jgi:hypothetical protein